MKKVITQILFGLFSLFLLIVYPVYLFGIDAMTDLLNNRPLKHLEEDIVGLLCCIGSMLLYIDIFCRRR